MDMKGWVSRTRRYLDARPAEEIGRAYTGAEIKTVLAAAIHALIEELSQGGELSVEMLGRFTVKECAARRVRNNLNGQLYEVPAQKIVHFRSSKALKQAMNMDGPTVGARSLWRASVRRPGTGSQRTLTNE